MLPLPPPGPLFPFRSCDGVPVTGDTATAHTPQHERVCGARGEPSCAVADVLCGEPTLRLPSCGARRTSAYPRSDSPVTAALQLESVG